jgi:type IV secretion system protein VirB9
VLTPQEKAAVAIAQKWQVASATGMKPVAGPEGSVRFVFGAQQINVVCAVLQICDIELQPGEQVNNLNVGDPRFTVEPSISGVGAGEVQHLIIKPLDVGLDTSLVVTTNRRTYHIRLRSHRTEFMPRVGFTYTEDAVAKWDAIRTREVKEKQERTIPKTGEYLGDLNFNYEVTGSAAWKPIRVYNDGTKTILQMPTAMAQTEAPTLLVVRKDGGLFTDDETVMVNYRVQGDRYIVDTIFDKAILIAGVGSSQDRVTIVKGK